MIEVKDLHKSFNGNEVLKGINETIECSCLPGAVDFYKNLIIAMEK